MKQQTTIFFLPLDQSLCRDGIGTYCIGMKCSFFLQHEKVFVILGSPWSRWCGIV